MPRAGARPGTCRGARRPVALAATALLVLVTAGGCSGAEGRPNAGTGTTRASDHAAVPTDELPRSLTGQLLEWGTCPPPPDGSPDGPGAVPAPLPDGTRWECAELTAPLDYRKPEGETIDLSLVRARTSGSTGERIGSLLFNFGGPGASGVSTLPAFGQDFERLRTRYDLVSFDPRGVSRSEGVRCLAEEELDAYYAADWTPETAREERELVDRQKAYARACQQNSGRILPHLTTTATARDLDLIREVLGDEKLSYFGISYGTELGGVYAHLFPRRVGRAVFDGVVDPTLDPEQSALAQAKGFQHAFRNYLDSCARKEEGHSRCPLGTDPERSARTVTDLLRRLDEQPMSAGDGGRQLTESLAANGIAQSLYSPDLWDYLSQGLEEAADGNGRTLLALGDAMVGRSDRGTYTSLQASLTAIRCADNAQRHSVAQIRKALPRFTRASAIFGPMSAWGMSGCVGWPVEGQGGPPRVHAKGSAPILVVGNTGDPATPYQGTRRMKEALGPGVGVELTYEGEGHGAYNSGDRCVTRHVDRYLLEGQLPTDGTRCS